MPVNGFLTRLFKSDKDKKSKSSNHTSSAKSSSSNNVLKSNLPIVTVDSNQNSANSSRSNSHTILTSIESHEKLEYPKAVAMNSAASSASIIHPVDSHHAPHLKLARFLEKRHMKHHEFMEAHGLIPSSKSFINVNNNKNSSLSSASISTSNNHNHYTTQKSSTSLKSSFQPAESKFDDYDALVKLVSKYGIIPNETVDLMKLLNYSDTKIEKVITEEKSDEKIQITEKFDDNTSITIPEAKNSSDALIIGKGAGGSVYPLYDSNHNHLYAMKKLRLQQSSENWSNYETKLHNEFKIANKLHHQNLIRTYDLLQDNDLFIIVMDYAPYDFFTMVMAGILSKHEIYCYFKQMCNGVNYMHSIGLAHRDLKLDNCVVDKNGILKIVDFGSSVIFDLKRYQNKGESFKVEKATGIMGSDPYLAPEVVTYPYYDPSLADVWSLAIIYCCMILRRFPWRIPKSADTSYKYFISEPGEIVDKNGKKKIVGPDRLLRLLPSSSKNVIDFMLKVDPLERYNMNQVLESHFVQKIKDCHYDEYNSDRNQGIYVASEDHTHHLITNKEFAEKNPEEVKQEKQREEEQASEILAENNLP
jgi:serine/threonine protein kinase